MAANHISRGYVEIEPGVIMTNPDTMVGRVYSIDPDTGLFLPGYNYGKNTEGNGNKGVDHVGGFDKTSEEFVPLGSKYLDDEKEVLETSILLGEYLATIGDRLDEDDLYEINNGRYFHDIIDRLVLPHRGRGYMINANAKTLDDALFTQDADHFGKSGIVFPNIGHSIISESDRWLPDREWAGPHWHDDSIFVGDINDVIRKIYNFPGGEWYYGWDGEWERGMLPLEGDNHPFSHAIVDNFKHSKLMDSLSDEEHDKIGKAKTYSQLKAALADILAKKIDERITNPRAREYIRDKLAGVLDRRSDVKYSYLANAALEGTPHGMYDRDRKNWSDIIHDKMMMDYQRTLGGTVNSALHSDISPKDVHLLGVAAPSARVVSAANVAKGKITGQRDFPSEIVVSKLVPKFAFGNAPAIFDIIRNYWALRLDKGLSGEDAWNEAWKGGGREYWGKDVDSDERMKDVYKSLGEEYNNYLRHQNICRGLKRGPGNG